MKASYYYKYKFVSPESLYAEVKEELKSYFQTGVIDDVLFPKYTEHCLGKLGRSSYKIEETVMRLEDFQANLPEGFVAVRELWLATSSDMSYRLPSAIYEQSTYRITSDRDRCAENALCAPSDVKITYKTTGQVLQTYKCLHLLKPGNIHAKENCSLDSWNISSSAMETFDIRGSKVVTNFPSGSLYMVYYVNSYDDNDYQLIPDNIRIQDYLKAYLKYKCFENIYNNISDETIRQIEGKMQYYEQKMWEAKAVAEVEIKKQTIEQQVRSAKGARNRLNKYNIS